MIWSLSWCDLIARIIIINKVGQWLTWALDDKYKLIMTVFNVFNSNPSPENECNYTVCNYSYYFIIVVRLSFDHKVNYCDGRWHCQLSTTLRFSRWYFMAINQCFKKNRRKKNGKQKRNTLMISTGDRFNLFSFSADYNHHVTRILAIRLV